MELWIFYDPQRFLKRVLHAPEHLLSLHAIGLILHYPRTLPLVGLRANGRFRLWQYSNLAEQLLIISSENALMHVISRS